MVKGVGFNVNFVLVISLIGFVFLLAMYPQFNARVVDNNYPAKTNSSIVYWFLLVLVGGCAIAMLDLRRKLLESGLVAKVSGSSAGKYQEHRQGKNLGTQTSANAMGEESLQIGENLLRYAEKDVNDGVNKNRVIDEYFGAIDYISHVKPSNNREGALREALLKRAYNDLAKLYGPYDFDKAVKERSSKR
ncbi:MAG: hypothetical protein Q7S74_03620 [Nanoarchaeota archaeon]|nr:hypothetical protein [Nanoarchaeota archaeon]